MIAMMMILMFKKEGEGNIQSNAAVSSIPLCDRGINRAGRRLGGVKGQAAKYSSELHGIIAGV